MKYLYYLLPKVALPQVALPMVAMLIFSALIPASCISLKNEAENGGETEAVYEGSGAYIGIAMGYRGIIRVRVGLNGGTIREITVVESHEDRNVGEAAIEELTDLVLMYNTTELDAVSGATETSRGFLQAIENAIMGP